MAELAFRIVPDEWLRDQLARPVFQWHVSSNFSASVVREALDVMKAQGAFAYAKIDASAVRVAKDLQAVGFYVVDTNLVFDKAIEPPPLSVQSTFHIRPTSSRDKPQVAALAYQSFQLTRFHLDPNIPKHVADSIKAAWASNYYEGKRGDDLLVAEHDGQIIGFIQLMNGGADDWIIDLIAVHERFRGRGVATAMIRYAESRTKRTRIVVGTQAANLPSLRLYESLGFRVRRTSFVFHAHFGHGLCP